MTTSVVINCDVIISVESYPPDPDHSVQIIVEVDDSDSGVAIVLSQDFLMWTQRLTHVGRPLA